MLQDNKRCYQQYANAYLGDGWEKCNKNELFYKYVEHENNIVLRNAYLSAIICRYWNLIERYYNMSKSSFIKEEVYNWLIQSVMHTLKKRVWENPNNILYKDPAGPDKALHCTMKSRRLDHYHRNNLDVRRANVNAPSVEGLIEEAGDIFPSQQSKDSLNLIEDISSIIIEENFKKRDFFTSLLVYNIIYCDVFDKDNKRSSLKLNLKKLSHCMRNISPHSYLTISSIYNPDKDLLKKEIDNCNEMRSGKMNKCIIKCLEHLKKSKYFKEYVNVN